MKEIEALWQEVRDLTLGNSSRIERLTSPPTPLRFLRDFVSLNKPCIISNATLHWPALDLWRSDDYLNRSLSSSSVSVHLTPDGRADALAPSPDAPPPSLCFASAKTLRLPFPEALDLIYRSNPENEKQPVNYQYRSNAKPLGYSHCDDHIIRSNFVAYAQQQNDCFRSEYSALASDCDPHIPWATEALGCLPEAVNLWIGTHWSETSFHKDHYENLYAVVCGEKHFLLLPPTDIHRMYTREYPAAQYLYSEETGEFKLELEEPKRQVPWCSVNPYPSQEDLDGEMENFPLYFNGPKPFECTVKAGEILYLPSMWFHHVRQSPDERGLTIAVNYWYDMQYDVKYAYFNFLLSIPYREAPPHPVSSEAENEEP